MRHGDDGTRVGREVLLQPEDGLGVEVVGRLVEEQQVRLLQEQLAQRDAATLTTGEVGDRAVRRRAAQGVHRLLELGVEVPRVGVVDLLLELAHLLHERVEVRVGLAHLLGDGVEPVELGLDLAGALLDVAEDGLVLVERRLLEEDAHGRARLEARLAVARLVEPSMIFRMVDLPAPLGPTIPILAPGKKDIETSSRMTFSLCALRARTMV